MNAQWIHRFGWQALSITLFVLPGLIAALPARAEGTLDKIARTLKDDRDANLIERNEAGVTVNRWTTTGFLAASATTNETAWLTWKVVRSMGVVGFDNQARV